MNSIAHLFPSAGQGLSVTVSCPACGSRHRLARRLREPETITLMCPVCEQIIWARFTERELQPR